MLPALNKIHLSSRYPFPGIFEFPHFERLKLAMHHLSSPLFFLLPHNRYRNFLLTSQPFVPNTIKYFLLSHSSLPAVQPIGNDVLLSHYPEKHINILPTKCSMYCMLMKMYYTPLTHTVFARPKTGNSYLQENAP